MESSSWDDTSNKKEDTSGSSAGRYARPGNFVFGPGRSAVFGSEIAPAEKPAAPLFVPRVERSAPETVSQVIPAEALLPPPVVETPQVVQVPLERPAYYAAHEASRAAEDDDDDEDDTPVVPPHVVPKNAEEPLLTADQYVHEVSLRSEPMHAAGELPPIRPVAETFHSAEPEESESFTPPTPIPAPVPEFRPAPPPVSPEATTGFAWRGAGGDKTPPPPPPETAFGFAEPPEPERPPAAPVETNPYTTAPSSGHGGNRLMYNTYYAPTQEVHNSYYDTRRKLAGVFATTLLVGWWVNHQSKKRDKALAGQNKALASEVHHIRNEYQESQVRNVAEHQNLRRSLAEQQSHGETLPGTLPPIQQRQEQGLPPRPVIEQIFGEQPFEGKPELEEGEHLRQSTWHQYVEKNGRVVEKIDYGSALQQERVQERSPTPFGANDARFAAGAQTNYYGTAQDPLLPSGQVPANHSLTSGQPTRSDPQHLLPEPQHPLVATLASPWLWLGVGVLMIAFFLAATI